jgi:mono/diheme cytochrome c family protein
VASGTDPLFREDATKSGVFRLATVFLRNTVGASAAFILAGSFCASASAQTPVERGSYLVNSIGACGNCHGRDASGKGVYTNNTLAGGFVFDEIEPDLGHVIAPNITPDKDTGIGKWSEADIVMALRNGKRPDGSIIGPPMPIPVYGQLSDQDATAIAVYLLSAKPVKNSVEKSKYKIPLQPNYGPTVTHVESPSPADKVAYGGYLVDLGHCVLCHTPAGKDKPFNMDLAFAGGRPFPAFSGVPATVSRNITSDPEHGIGKWTDAQIKIAITKGIEPNGNKLTGPMAFAWYAKLTPADLDGIVAYLRTIKPIKAQ